MELEFEISKDDLTRGGGEIPNSFREMISQHSNAQGLIILPSDTCYSLAAVCKFIGMADDMNLILNREKVPFSVATSDIDMVIKFREEQKNGGDIFYNLLERFTPGPITIITYLKTEYYTLAKIIEAPDYTAGFRIPSSIVERNVSKFVNYPITTVPIKDKKNIPIKDYNEALESVQANLLKRGKKIKIAGINTKFPFEDKLSTVVRVKWAEHKLGLIREGYFTKSDLKNFLKDNKYFNWDVVIDKV